MALALTQVTSGGGEYRQGGAAPEVQSMDLPDWAVTAGDLLIVGLGGAAGEANPPTSPFWSVTGGGLTWTRRASGETTAGAYLSQVAIFTAVASSTTTITDMTGVPSSDNLQVMYTFATASGYNTSTPIGATAGLADGSTDGQKDITLSGTPASSSYIYAVAFVNADEGSGKIVDHGSSVGWSEAFDVSPTLTGSYMWGCWEGQYKTGHTSTTVRWDDIKPAGMTVTTYSFAGAAIEILEAAGAAPAAALRGIVRSGLRPG